MSTSPTSAAPSRPASGRTGRPPRSERQQLLVRLRVARHAAQLFGERGVAATTGEAIAESVGMSVRTLWRHFPTKESCVRPYFDLSMAQAEDLLRSWPPDTTLVGFLRQSHAAGLIPPPDDAVMRVIRMAITDPALRLLWIEVHESALPRLGEILAERGGLDPDSLEVKVQAAMINGALRAATEEYARRVEPGHESAAYLFRCLDKALGTAELGLPS